MISNYMIRISDSSLDSFTKESKEVERLISKKTPPSRKTDHKTGPKYDNRRDRIHADGVGTDDDDINSQDSDMSLASAQELVSEKKKEKEKEPAPDYDKETERSNSIIKELSRTFGRGCLPLGEAVLEYGSFIAESGTLKDVKEWVADQKSQYAQLSRIPLRGSALDIVKQITDAWPSNKPEYVGRKAGIIKSVLHGMDKIGLPKSFSNVFKSSPGDVVNNRELILQVIEEAGRTLSSVNLENIDFIKFATLAAIYEIIKSNPDDLDLNKVKSSVDDLTKEVYDKARQVLSISKWMSEWNEVLTSQHFSKMDKNTRRDWVPADQYYDQLMADSTAFFGRRSDPIFNPKIIIEEMEKSMKKEFGDVPKPIREMAESVRAASSIAASYGTSLTETMPRKTASYHGVLHQGHPSGPTNTGYKSYDKRYFKKDNYDSIIAAAEDLLKEDWLKHGWDGGAVDAPLRAALDLSIHLADSNLYQSKIDVETYDMLLNRLAGWKHDQFSETIIPGKDGSNRSASMNKPSIQIFLRIASDLRHSDPRMAIEIVKTIRSMRVAEDQGDTAPVHTQQGQDTCAQEQPVAISEKDMNKFVEGHIDMDDLKKKTNELKTYVTEEDMEKFLKGIEDISKTLQKKVSTRIAGFLDDLPDLKEEAGDMGELLESQSPGIKKLESAISADDITAYIAALDTMFEDIQAHLNSRKGSIRVNLGSLVRLAYEVPSTRSILLPILIAAKKKKGKKSKKAPKKSDKASDKKKPSPVGKKKKKAPPFGGKKAPPFGGKKAPPFGGKKKASVSVTTDDSEW